MKVLPFGSAFSEVMIVGLRPGKKEVAIGEPFSGPVGSLVRHISLSLLSRAYFTNLLDNPHTPLSDGWEKKSRLDRDLARVSPKVIVTLGGRVTSHILGRKASIMTVHGLLIPRHDFLVLPVYDPGYVARSGGLTSEVGMVWVQDWEELRNVDGLRDLTTYTESRAVH